MTLAPPERSLPAWTWLYIGLIVGFLAVPMTGLSRSRLAPLSATVVIAGALVVAAGVVAGGRRARIWYVAGLVPPVAAWTILLTAAFRS